MTHRNSVNSNLFGSCLHFFFPIERSKSNKKKTEHRRREYFVVNSFISSLHPNNTLMYVLFLLDLSYRYLITCKRTSKPNILFVCYLFNWIINYDKKQKISYFHSFYLLRYCDKHMRNHANRQNKYMLPKSIAIQYKEVCCSHRSI